MHVEIQNTQRSHLDQSTSVVLCVYGMHARKWIGKGSSPMMEWLKVLRSGLGVCASVCVRMRERARESYTDFLSEGSTRLRVCLRAGTTSFLPACILGAFAWIVCGLSCP